MADEKDEVLATTAAAEPSAEHAVAEPPPEPPAEPAPPPPEKARRGSAAPALFGALILGALGGFGGAYALRYIDAMQGPDPVDHYAELNARADALEHKAEAASAALEGRLNAVEGGAAKVAAATNAAMSELRVALTQRLAAAAGGGQGAPALATGPIEDKIAALEKKLGSLDAVQQKAGEIDAVRRKLGEIETTLAKPAVDPRVEQERASADQRARALAAAQSKGVLAASLTQRVSRGEPFANEVAALENLGVDPARLAPLRAAAKTGVASIGDLADQFVALAPTLETPEAPKPETGLLERLARDASNLVRIRRSGDPRDADIPGRIAAIEGALARLDVAKAYAAWLQLPEAARTKSAAWGAAAKARLDAVAAAGAIEAEAVGELGKMKS